MRENLLNKIFRLRRKPPKDFLKKLELLVTLWPSFPHFSKFVNDSRISGIRLNSAMINNPELEKELGALKSASTITPLYFDAKGRQPRVIWVDEKNTKYLDIRLNHPISVKTPIRALFKAGADSAILERLEEGGSRLIFKGGPAYMVHAGESIHILDSSFAIKGQLFTDTEKEKISLVKNAGFSRYFLSYVECQKDIDEFRELVGKDALIMLKIENQRGLDFVEREFKKTDNTVLVAARGDLYIELGWPHKIIEALELIISKDREACVGSRIMLSVVNDSRNGKIFDALKIVHKEDEAIKRADPNKIIETALLGLINRDTPSCADFCELAWLYSIGYRSMMLCDEICLREDLLSNAIGAFSAFRDSKEKSGAI